MNVLIIFFVVLCVLVNIILIFCVFLSSLIIIGVLFIMFNKFFMLLGLFVKFVIGIFIFFCESSCSECNLLCEWVIVIDLFIGNMFIILN